MKLSAELSNLLGVIKTQLPRIKELKAEAKAQVRLERQCTGITVKGKRCRAWSVVPLKEHPTPQGQRRYYKRTRKKQIKIWLKSLGI